MVVVVVGTDEREKRVKNKKLRPEHAFLDDHLRDTIDRPKNGFSLFRYRVTARQCRPGVR